MLHWKRMLDAKPAEHEPQPHRVLTTTWGDEIIAANPRQVEWGSAPILVRSTHQAGPVRIIARSTFEGTHAPSADTLTIESIPYDMAVCYQECAFGGGRSKTSQVTNPSMPKLSDAERRRQLEEVEKQQQDFGIK